MPRKRLRPSDRHVHLDLREMPGMALEIRAAHQRTVEPRRGNFQPIGAVDRVGDIEDRRQRARNLFAILDRQRAVRPLGHDLHRAAFGAGNAHPHQPIAHALDHRLGDRGDARGQSRLRDQARIGGRLDCSYRSSIRLMKQIGFGTAFESCPRESSNVGPDHAPFRGRSGNKKERVPGGAHSQKPTGSKDRYEMSDYRPRGI